MTQYPAFSSAGLTALVVLFLCACQMNKAEPQLALPTDQVLLQTNQTVQAIDGLMVRVDTVSVSICPKNASCFAPKERG
jgi:outer membrane biogenesis lipoprotein LolB